MVELMLTSLPQTSPEGGAVTWVGEFIRSRPQKKRSSNLKGS